MDEKTEKKNKFSLASYGKAVAFLLLEILAVLSFSLGGSFYFFAILSMVILALIILVTFRQIKVDGVATIGLFIVPLVVFGLLSALSYFKYDPGFVLGDSPFLFIIPIALACFAATGYFINLTGCFKIHHALIVIYSAIALLTLINLVVTMIQFVPFYTLKYTNYYFYYDGIPSPEPVGKMGYFLMGFSLMEVSLSYFSFYPIVLLTAFLPLGHMKFKDNRKLFVIYLAYGLLGLISLVLTINKITLLMFFGVSILIGVIAIYDKFTMPIKPLKIAGMVLCGLFVFGVLFVFLNSQESVGVAMRVSFLRNLTSSNPLFNRLFNANRFVSAYNSILDGLFATTVYEGSRITLKLFGFPINGGYVNLFGDMHWELTDSNSFFFDSFFTSGLFGVLALTVFMFIGIKKVFEYYATSEDDQKDKVMILGFVVVSIAYAFFNYDCTPTVFYDTVIPFYLNNIFLIDLFLFGYCYFNAKKKVKEPVVEEVMNNEEAI